jgi:hypothetical protein
VFSSLLAIPGAPSVRLRVGQGPEDVVEVDELTLTGRRAWIENFLNALPLHDGSTWRDVRPYVEDNGLYAKAAISLGDLLGLWEMYPPRDSTLPWSKDHPKVALCIRNKSSERRKGNSATAEADTLHGEQLCACCRRATGPAHSTVHHLPAMEDRPEMCIECALGDCALPGHCSILEVADLLGQEISLTEDIGVGDPVDFESYLNSFNES